MATTLGNIYNWLQDKYSEVEIQIRDNRMRIEVINNALYVFVTETHDDSGEPPKFEVYMAIDKKLWKEENFEERAIITGNLYGWGTMYEAEFYDLFENKAGHMKKFIQG